jgi:radical SAM/Cys-rich protein
MSQSLKFSGNDLSNSEKQLLLLEFSPQATVPGFSDKLTNIGAFPLRPKAIDILQINLGKMCNQVCKHCHVDAGPDRKEIMEKETMEIILHQIKQNKLSLVDLTGGAPEMNPHFRWFVIELSKLGVRIMVRCNLTIILANPKYHDLPEFFKEHKVEVISSLPFYTGDRTDRQRGNGVFAKSIEALKRLNAVGYGLEESGLILNLVYNPAGAFLPPSQAALQGEYKESLMQNFGISFNQLYVITNMPISRYLDYLIRSKNFDRYMRLLSDAFNPAAIEGLMCKNTLSVGWDGYLYDCDFNQMLDLKVDCEPSRHIADFDLNTLNNREIKVNQHCFGCTAGSGSSCGGAITN